MYKQSSCSTVWALEVMIQCPTGMIQFLNVKRPPGRCCDEQVSEYLGICVVEGSGKYICDTTFHALTSVFLCSRRQAGGNRPSSPKEDPSNKKVMTAVSLVLLNSPIAVALGAHS